MRPLIIALIGLVLTACASPEGYRPAEVSVVYEPRVMEIPVCTTTGSMLIVRKGEPIPDYYWKTDRHRVDASSGDHVFFFATAACSDTEKRRVTRTESDKMLLDEFNTRMQHEEGFKERVESWTVL